MRKVVHILLRLSDPMFFLSLHRRLSIYLSASVGTGLRVTHRAEIFHQGNLKEQISIGDQVTLDGTLQTYNQGWLKIGDYTFIGRSRIYCAKEISIGRYCLISDNVCILDSNLHPVSARQRAGIAENWASGIYPNVYSNVPSERVLIEDHCWIGYGSTILKGVHIGEGSIVGAGSVVTKDVPPWTIVAGNPARVIREIPENER